MKRNKTSKLLASIITCVLSFSFILTKVQAAETVEPMVFEYTQNAQTVTLIPGTYQIECWGAQGGNSVADGKAYTNTALGGYSKGVLELADTTTLYIYVGGKGGNGSATAKSSAAAGWNGGGKGGADRDNDGSGAGGGATDIRLEGGSWNELQSLRSRIMVAGGSSGMRWGSIGGIGGGLSGGNGDNKGGTQTTGYSFGVGGTGLNYLSGAGVPGSGGGGGYYGGTATALGVAGGGSGFISGHSGCDAIDSEGNHTGQSIHYSGMHFTETVMESGVRAGNGRVLITPVTEADAKLHVLLKIDEQVRLSMSHDLPKNMEFVWTTTDEAVVTVDADGVVTAIGEGTANIWAESQDGTYKDYIPFKVLENAEEIRLGLHLSVGETRNLWYGDDPSAVIWMSMDPSVVTVDSDGRVTGVSQGLCIVKGERNGVEQYIYVRVNDIEE